VGENAAVSPRRSTVARQILVLQVLVVVVVVVGAVTLVDAGALDDPFVGGVDDL
jgi:hypothetical protein